MVRSVSSGATAVETRVRSRYIATNGIRLHALEAGEGPLVVLWHGFPETSRSWRHQLGPLADAGFHAVAIDMPGYGRSDKPDRDYDVVWLTDCFAGVVPALGHQKAAIVGHDWGGHLVWPFARLHPERTAAVVALNTPDLVRTDEPPVQLLRRAPVGQLQYVVFFQDPAAQTFLENDAEGFLRSILCGHLTINHAAFDDAEIAALTEEFRPAGAFGPPLAYYRSMDRNWELTRAVAANPILVPCLMVMAENDPILTPAMTEGMETSIPQLSRVLIRECGHWTQQERPAEVSEALTSFLAQLDPWA